jgi:hypothetical protein
MPRTRARSSRLTASSALRPLRRQSGVVFQAERLIQAKAEARPRRLCPLAPVHARAIRRLWAKYASCARVHWAHSAQIRL